MRHFMTLLPIYNVCVCVCVFVRVCVHRSRSVGGLGRMWASSCSQNRVQDPRGRHRHSTVIQPLRQSAGEVVDLTVDEDGKCPHVPIYPEWCVRTDKMAATAGCSVKIVFPHAPQYAVFVNKTK